MPSPSKSFAPSVPSSAFGNGRLPGYGTALAFRSRADQYSNPSSMLSPSVSLAQGFVLIEFSRSSLRPSLSSSKSEASGVPSPSQSGGGGGGGGVVPGPGSAAPWGRISGEREVLVFGPRTFVKTIRRKRVSFLPPRPSSASSGVRLAGTRTSMRVFDALRGRTRTDLPSLAREKKTRLLRVPDAKFFPLSVSTPPIATLVGVAEVITGRGVRAKAELARPQTASAARTETARRRRMRRNIGHSPDGFRKETLRTVKNSLFRGACPRDGDNA